MLNKIKCFLGFHKWNIVSLCNRVDWFSFFLFTYASQYGIRKCQCCKRMQYIYRNGTLGIDDKPVWQKTDRKTFKQYRGRLPNKEDLKQALIKENNG